MSRAGRAGASVALLIARASLQGSQPCHAAGAARALPVAPWRVPPPRSLDVAPTPGPGDRRIRVSSSGERGCARRGNAPAATRRPAAASVHRWIARSRRRSTPRLACRLCGEERSSPGPGRVKCDETSSRSVLPPDGFPPQIELPETPGTIKKRPPQRQHPQPIRVL